MLGCSLHAFGWTSSRVFLVRLSSSTTRPKMETPPNWQMQLVPLKKLTMVAPKESGSVCFETTVECHVALDVHVKLQKWNSYHFVSILYHALPGNLPKSFEELNFRGEERIRKNRKNYAPRKFGAIRYVCKCIQHGIYTYVAVPGRNRTLFQCVFRAHYRVRSAVAQNFR